MTGNRLRLVNPTILVVEGSEDLELLPIGAAVMFDQNRTEAWRRHATSAGRPDKVTDYANVYRDGILSLHRGLISMDKGATERLLVNARTLRELRAALMQSYTLNLHNEAAMATYAEKLLGIAERFKSSDPDSLKAEIRHYLMLITPKDILGRGNIERWPLMFMKAQTLLEHLHAHLTAWHATTGEAEQFVSNLREATLNDAASFLVIVEQARRSRALLGDATLVDNKDNAVLAWPKYCEALEGAFMRPFAGWFQRAARHWRQAIVELEKSDMSGLAAAKQELDAVAVCLRMPALMDEIDVTTQPFSWSKDTPLLRLDAASLHAATTSLERVDIELMESAHLLLEHFEQNRTEIEPHLLSQALYDSRTARELLRSSNHSNANIHEVLTAMNRNLMLA
jgi:hypothetical protein